MSARQVTAFAPGTVANLGPGFDVLGLAIEGPGDTVIARRAPGGLRIATVTGEGGALPTDVDANTAGVAARETLRRLGIDPATAGVELEVHKGMPIGSGLGSSAASAAAAAYAVNLLCGAPLRREDLIGPCVEAEAVVSGRHADNVAAALLGGLVLVRSVDPLDVVRLPTPSGLRLVVVTPDFELPTRAARAALPAQVSLKAMVTHAAQLATVVAACYADDPALLTRGLRDPVVTPARAALIPGGEAVMRAAEVAGALGSGICGAGPSLFALCHAAGVARAVEAAMLAAFAAAGLTARACVSPLDCPGVTTR